MQLTNWINDFPHHHTVTSHIRVFKILLLILPKSSYLHTLLVEKKVHITHEFKALHPKGTQAEEQDRQVEEPACEYCPTGQTVQRAAPAKETVPEGHITAAETPCRQ